MAVIHALSYRRPDTGNSLNDMVSAWQDLSFCLPHLLVASDEQAFLVWLDKCRTIDNRATLRWLQQHADELPARRLAVVRMMYGKERI